MLETFMLTWALGFCFNTGTAFMVKEVMNDERLLERDSLLAYAVFGPILSIMLIGGFIFAIWKAMTHVNK